MSQTETFTESLFREYGHNDYTPGKKTNFQLSQQSTRPQTTISQTTTKTYLSSSQIICFPNSHFTEKNYDMRIDELHPPKPTPPRVPRWQLLYNYGVSEGERKKKIHEKALKRKFRGPAACPGQRFVGMDK